MNSSLFPVLALFSEVDLFHNWITQLNRFTLVGEPTRFMKLLHYTLDLPWPLSNRDISLACHGVAVPENKSALIVLRDMPESYLSYTSPPVDPNNVRISIPVGGLNVMFRGPN
ncbi:MAG: hypothetical protein V2I33_22260 [Kangiellaceae bacterium]|nr:hypothetical protein [Kangiellaceae bacterium]